MALAAFKRYGLVRGCFGAGSDPADKVAAYLPSNYKVLWSGEFAQIRTASGAWVPFKPEVVVVIEGRDKNGWTLEGYVAPRLGSGLMACEEIDLACPVMDRIPA